MIVKFKKHTPDAVTPQYAKLGDAALDLTSISVNYVNDDEGSDYYEYDTGISVEIPPGYVGLVFPRSSVSKTNLSLTNSVGIIDSGYRGTIKARFRPTSAGNFEYKIGERIAQLLIIPYPQVTLLEVDNLSETSRGFGGFGSTGA